MRCGAVVIAVVAGASSCGGAAAYRWSYAGVRATRDEVAATLVERTSRGDAHGLAKMFSDPFGYSGLWFPDADCRKKLGVYGKIAGPAIEVFAQCLAKLRLQQSARDHVFPDVALLTYEPGIELAVQIDGGREPKIRWIGYAANVGSVGREPTVTQTALLEHRTSSVAATRGTAPAGIAWFKICLDPTGAVSDIQPELASSVVAQEELGAQVQDWRFRPFMLDDRPAAVCSIVRVPDADGSDVRVQLPDPTPAAWNAGMPVLVPGAFGPLLEGTTEIEPDERMNIGVHDVTTRLVDYAVSVLYCVGKDGRVNAARVNRASLAGFDKKLEREVGKWRFAPLLVRGAPVEACSVAWFVAGSSDPTHH